MLSKASMSVLGFTGPLETLDVDFHANLTHHFHLDLTHPGS